MKENPKPRRRWFGFSLRTMLVLVALLCIYFGWALNWKRQRHEFLKDPAVVLAFTSSEQFFPLQLRTSKWAWLIGEQGYAMIVIGSYGKDSKAENQDSKMKEGKRLFPEAFVTDATGLQEAMESANSHPYSKRRVQDFGHHHTVRTLLTAPHCEDTTEPLKRVDNLLKLHDCL